MTKKQIYEYLNYQGKYDSGVKKRLKKLIKKYHPDLNNGDDTVMKLINEVKKEIESNNSKNTLEHTVKQNKKSNSFSYINIINVIKKLNQEVADLNKKIQLGYHDEYELLKEYNNTKALYNALILNRKILEKEVTNLKKLSIIDKLNIFLTIILSLLIFISSLFIIGLVMIIYIEFIYTIIRLINLKTKKDEISKIDIVVKKYEDMSLNIKAKIDDLNKDIFDIKKSHNKVKQTIRYYEKMISDDDCEKESYKRK